MEKPDLNKKYHRILKGKKYFYFSVICGAFITLFLLIFQPFGIYNWPVSDKYIIIFGYGAITTGVLLFSEFITNKLVLKPVWLFWEYILLVFIKTFLIGIANGIYSVAVGIMPFNLETVLWYIWVTFAVGLFPITAVFIVESQKSNKKSKDEPKSRKLSLTDENENQVFIIFQDQLIFIQSADNYCEVIYVDDGKKKRLIRNTLKNLSGDINEKWIIRCHRSFIVNLRKVSRWSGNAQGMTLFFDEIDETVPVSRKYLDDVRKKLD